MPHIHDKIDFVVTPVIIHPNKDKVLMVNHPKYGAWINIGGHIELDEYPDQTLFREIKEECGLEVEVLSEKPDFKTDKAEVLLRPRFVDIHDAQSPHRHVAFVYFCLAKSEDFVLSDEHLDMEWFTIDDIETRKGELSDLAHYYAKQALEEVKN